MPSLVWSAGDGIFRGASQRDHVFLDCFALASLTQWVMEPTFISSGNTFDLYLASEIDRVGDVNVLAPFPRCGHCPLVGEYL